jgi:dihydroorotase-like cyclic amidohydrolase
MKLFINASLPTSSAAMKRVNVLFDKQIVKISADEIISEEEPETIDLKGKILLPGAIEAHSHIFGPQQDISQALAKATKSALKGGWTTLAEMSFHTRDPIFESYHLKDAIKKIQGTVHTDMAFWAHVDVNDYPYYAESAQELWNKGVVGILLMTPSPNEAITAMSFTEIMDLFMDIYESDTEFAFQGFDVDTHEDYSFAAQMDGIKKILRRMQENPIHVPRISSYQTIEFINTISKRSDISFAMNMADLMHLLDPEQFSAQWNTDFAEYQTELWELLRTNKIYLLSNSCTEVDTPYEQFKGNPPAMMEYSYLWVLSELWKKRKVPLATCLKMLSENPAKRLGIYPQKGCLNAGSDADFVIYDPNGQTAMNSTEGKPLELAGAIDQVWLRGTLQDLNSPAQGEFVARTNGPKRRHNHHTWI